MSFYNILLARGNSRINKLIYPKPRTVTAYPRKLIVDGCLKNFVNYNFVSCLRTEIVRTAAMKFILN